MRFAPEAVGRSQSPAADGPRSLEADLEALDPDAASVVVPPMMMAIKMTEVEIAEVVVSLHGTAAIPLVAAHDIRAIPAVADVGHQASAVGDDSLVKRQRQGEGGRCDGHHGQHDGTRHDENRSAHGKHSYSPINVTRWRFVPINGRWCHAFSRKIDNHVYVLSLYFVFYNFVRMHKTLRMSPAMAANVSDRLWSMEDIATLIDAQTPKPSKRGPYAKRAATAP